MIKGFKTIDLSAKTGFTTLPYPALSVTEHRLSLNSKARAALGDFKALQFGIDDNQSQLAVLAASIDARGAVIATTGLKKSGIICRSELSQLLAKISNSKKPVFKGHVKEPATIVFDLTI
ncbi:hypothetical protein OIU41_11550 [Lacticaseibacillus paracasei]|uniref:hypothetical protein n=1 Tax=Lacticaseibacillus paracasei TaxID=1597 RepID=UPI00339323FD